MSSPLRAPDPGPLRRGRLPGVGRAGLAAGLSGRPPLSLVPRLHSRAPRIPFVGLVSILLLGGVIGLLLFNTSMQQASFTASELEERAATLQARQEALATEIDALANPTHLAQLACAQGLVAGPGPAFLELSTGAVEGTPSVAVAGPCTAAGSERPARPEQPAGSETGSGAASGATGRPGR